MRYCLNFRFLLCAFESNILPATPWGVFSNIIISPNLQLTLTNNPSQKAHFNAPKFFTELKDNTEERFLSVVKASFGFSIAIFAAMTSLGFLTFGGACSGVILNNYAATDKLMGISRIAVAVSLIGSYPLAFVGARDGVLDLFKVKNRSNLTLNALTVGLLTGVTGLALVIPDVSFVLSFFGATLGNAIIYVFPAIMFRGAVKKMSNASIALKREVNIALGSAGFGIVMGLVGKYMVFCKFKYNLKKCML